MEKLRALTIPYKKIILIFCLAIILRIIIATIHLLYWTPYNQFETFWSEFLMYRLEPYADYKFWYQSQVYRFVYTDWMPYSPYSFPDFTAQNWEEVLSYLNNLLNELSTHNLYYPPFFLYILCIPAFISIDLVFIPIFLADILIPFIIYKILIDIKGKTVAEWGFMVSLLCPLSILYNGGLFLNTSLVSFFFILTLYFIFKEKYLTAVVLLSFSCLIKQIMIFFVIPIVVYLALMNVNSEKSKPIHDYFKKMILYGSVLSGILVLGSLPWVITHPHLYFNALNVGQSATIFPTFNVPKINTSMHWYDFLIELNAPYWVLYIVGFPNFTLTGIIIMEIVVVFLMIYWHHKKKLNWVRFLDLIVFTAFLSHLFLLKGVYKYYFTFHVPLIILWICFHFGELLSSDRSKRVKISLLLLGISIGFLLILRQFYLLIIWSIFIYIIMKSRSFNKKKYDTIERQKKRKERNSLRKLSQLK